MVKSFHLHLVNGDGKNYLAFIGGVSLQFGLGFNISRYGFSLEVGPFWIALEW